ncbi:Trans-enoyl reductase lepG [Hyphodiscus hymeniophilus]|uniref:Trans-enoyl reductase lepG n=1 Tax=Hyphodiscus hymeniophilus TaxID=353542 RepID=A0A9P6VMP2_9HELO|nr:Trans-enoyl reductase lepG [Hyphodiscus hymeniophilus]
MSLPREMQALVFCEAGEQVVKSIPMPDLRPSYILIKVRYVALNPTDWKHAFYGKGASPFSILGCDFAGTVISIGAEVTKQFEAGDEVYGCAHGGNFNQGYDGAFAEYAMVKGDVTMHVPSTPAFGLDALSTIPLGSITVGQGLFQPGKGLGLAWPGVGKGGEGEWLLIYGGSPAANIKHVEICLGYNPLRDIPQICADALSDDPGTAGQYSCILTADFPREDVKSTFTLMYTMFGEEFDKYGENWPASKEDYNFAKRWMELTEKLVAQGKLRPHPVKLCPGGLEAVGKGIEELMGGKISGEKMVYSI